MCGRFTLTTPQDIICDYFGINNLQELQPRYNIAPGADVLVVRDDEAGQRIGAQMRWGLVPSWMKADQRSNAMINARVETAAVKPSFRSAFKRRRCLVAADGFYEWHGTNADGKKQPYDIHLAQRQPFGFAGLWEHWQDHDTGEVIDSCTILTRDANPQLAQIHHRMPIIVAPEHFDGWLDSNNVDSDALHQFILVQTNPSLQMDRVSSVMNNARFEGPQCIEPLSEEE